MDPRFPIGEFQYSGTSTPANRQRFIATIAETPPRMRKSVAGLSESQLDTPYRDGGWTVRQVVHHVPDSHLNAYVRFKLTLTEDVPTIKPYDEKAWATLEDSRSTPIETSLALLENVHLRLVIILRSIQPSQWGRKFNHPERGEMDLDALLALYAWHGPHHVAHIEQLRKQKGW